MRVNINKEEMRREWVMNRWYEKAAFLLGCVWIALFLIGFIIGFTRG